MELRMGVPVIKILIFFPFQWTFNFIYKYETITKKIIYSLSLILISLISCNITEPPPPDDNRKITLTFEDASCTEAWIQLTTENLQLPASINIFIDDSLFQYSILSTQDSLLCIDSLLPNQTYTFQSVIQPFDQTGEVKSNKLTITTMDTTSHNFTFETFIFGGTAGSSSLYDVAIINENNIWCVGEINIADTSINGYTTYNAVHWNGSEWELKRIKTNACGGVEYPPIQAIFAFSSDDILFAHIDGSLSRYDGIKFTNDCSLITQLNGSANKMWGESRNDFYVVSGNGFIARCQNGQWRRIESGTTTHINDAWGIVNDNNETIVYCPASSFFTPGDKKILRIKNNQVDSISWDMDKLLYSVWTSSERYLFVCGSGAFENKSGGWKEISLPQISMNRIRGNDINDIFITGDFGFVGHFNGLSWITYENLFEINTAYYSLSMEGNMVLLVGWSNGRGIITIGMRN